LPLAHPNSFIVLAALNLESKVSDDDINGFTVIDNCAHHLLVSTVTLLLDGKAYFTSLSLQPLLSFWLPSLSWCCIAAVPLSGHSLVNHKTEEVGALDWHETQQIENC
jgi:hypothetical protein